MKNQVSVLSLDLGSNLGWSRCVCTLRPSIHINVVDHGTIYLDQLTTERMKKEHNEILSRHRVRMAIYEEVIRKLTDQVKFDSFITEDVFCVPNRIHAYKLLVLYMDTLERIVNIEKQRRLFTIPATVIKRHISDYGLQEKTLVQQAVLNNPAITIKSPSTMSHHESDCIAGCWAFVHEFLMTLV